MIVGIPREIKPAENRVSMTPSAVHELGLHGHRVLVECGAGLGSGFRDKEYEQCGAHLRDSAHEVWGEAELVVKVKEPTKPEYGYFRGDLILLTYLHLAADRPLTEALLSREVTGIAYETVQREDGSLPLLAPMSEIAGRIAVQEAAVLLARHRGGKGILMGGVAGTRPARVLILGAGVSGRMAASAAAGLGAEVTVMDINIDRLRAVQESAGGLIKTAYPTRNAIASLLPDTDIVIGCVLIPGGKAPHLISRQMLGTLEAGSVLVDVAIDQGGCFETSRPTTHESPTYTIDGIVHYCVANMPGSMPRSATTALSNATLPYALRLADLGLRRALVEDPALERGLNTFSGRLTNERVADSFGLTFERFSAEPAA
jgi:alanine dehydrogenase